ncbi:TOBE domain-containing protein [Mycobacterium sp. SMC-4]|uniref:TOBE domain-containing protein n=1 Tax=Mycobacterium sp. SMC-4 TaxID=2857059 RepID=UPI003D074D7F
MVPALRIKEAATLLGVSDDTVRRWIDSGALTSSKDDAGRKVIPGDVLAEFAREHAAPPPDLLGVGSSARNRLVGLVTKVTADRVMSEVQMQCGPFTIVSLMSSESVKTLGLEPGVVAVAVVKATTVIVETPVGSS